MILILLVPSILFLILVVLFFTKRFSPEDRQRKKLNAGIFFYRKHDFDSAFDFFDNKIKAGEKCEISYLYRGLCHAKMDNLNSALFDLTTVLSYDNSVVEVYLQRGKIYNQLGEKEKAYRDFERAAFYSNGRNPEILRYRGISLIDKGQYFQAARSLTKAVELGDEEANLILMAPPFHNAPGIRRGSFKKS